MSKTEIGSETVAVVTGAAGGMGLSIVKALAARGAQTVIVDIELAAAQAAAKEVEAVGGRAVARQADVSDQAAMTALADSIFAEFGRVDILCNNAGVTMRPFRAIWEADIRDYRWMMEINYFGVVHGVLAFLPRMMTQTGHRHIVNTSSMVTLEEVPGHAMYGASKGAVDAFSDALRAELKDHAQDIGVTILYPGYVPTRIGTSERLRDAADRSDARGVTPYPFTLPPRAHNAPVAAESVGAMVIEAIEQNRPYCLTHPAPLDTLSRRLEDWRAGHNPSLVQAEGPGDTNKADA